MIPDTERWQRLVGLGPEKVGQLQERLDSLASLLTGLQMLVQKLTTAGLDLGELTTAINEYQSLIAERRQQLPQE